MACPVCRTACPGRRRVCPVRPLSPREADSSSGPTPGRLGGAPTSWPHPPATPARTVRPGGGRFVERSCAGPAGGRPYKLYVPSGYTGQQAVPLVVMLHGCTQNPDDFAAGTSMNELAEERTFLVAYPAQAQNANMQKCWNGFKAPGQ